MEPLAEAKSSLEIETLTLDNLECHFNWKPEYGTTSEGHLKNVIEKTEQKVRRHPQFTVAYRCTLAYLYTSTGIIDLNKASEYLKEETISTAKGTYKPEERWLDCDFIVRANRLKLGECENRGAIQNSNDELLQLSDLWADKRTKAALYVIKGATFSCFGPLCIQKAIDAYKSALQLAYDYPEICSNWQKFDWLWGYAFNLSRKTRRTLGLEANEEELKIWKEAFLWKDSKKLEIREPLFYAQYAEAIMLIRTEKKECEAMMEEAIRLWKKLDFERQRLDNLVIMIAQKFSQTCPEIGFKVKKFVEELNLFDILGDDTEMYRRFTQSLNYGPANQTAIEILEIAERRIGVHYNIQFDLQLLARKSKLMSDEWVRHQYNSLFQKYGYLSSNKAAIYGHRSKWLFHKEIYPKLILNRDRDSYDDKMLDECIFNLIAAQSNDVNDWFPPKNFESKLFLVLERRKSERPECFAWFKDNFCKVETSEEDEISKLYESVIKASNSSLERQTFARKHLGKFHLKCHKFKEAISAFRHLATSDEECKKFFVESVLVSPDQSMDELQECLELGNCNVIETILSILESEKKQVDVRSTLLNGKFFDDNKKTFLFFSTSNYKTCAMIYLLLEDEKSFFLNDAQSKSQDFVKNIKDRLVRFLDIPVEDPNVVKYALRHNRFEMIKSYLDLQKNSDTQKKESMTYLNIMTLNTLRDSRCALDACFSEYFNLDKNSYYPHAINQMNKVEKEMLTKRLDPGTNSRAVYLEKRLKEEWLPSADSLNPSKGVDYDVIENFLREALEKKGEFAEEILKFIAKREYQIIAKQAAWHVVWIKKDNAFKHNIHEIEGKLNENREITKMFPGAEMTAYELANKAADFAEQTLAVFVNTTEVGD